MGLAIAMFSCTYRECDEIVYGTNEDGSTYRECVVYAEN